MKCRKYLKRRLQINFCGALQCFHVLCTTYKIHFCTISTLVFNLRLWKTRLSLQNVRQKFQLISMMFRYCRFALKTCETLPAKYDKSESSIKSLRILICSVNISWYCMWTLVTAFLVIWNIIVTTQLHFKTAFKTNLFFLASYFWQRTLY